VLGAGNFSLSLVRFVHEKSPAQNVEKYIDATPERVGT